MPAYNSEATIVDSVGSVLAQTHAELEVVVVDDGSRVPVGDVLKPLGDPRVRVIEHPRNRGISAARNTAIAAARAPLVSQLDPDDLWESRYLESVLPLFEDPRVAVAYTNATILGHPTGHDDYIGDPTPHPIDTFPKLAEACPAPSPATTMRAVAVRAAGGYASWLTATQDYHLYLKLARAGWRFAYLHERLASYRWPQPDRGFSYDHARVERDLDRMWLGFALRHPLTPGPRRQLRVRLARRVPGRG